jgi:integrase
MPRRASVRYWPSRGGYCCKLAGVQHLLASGPDDYPDGPTFKAACKAFWELTEGALKPADDYNVVRVVLDAYLVAAEKQLAPGTFKNKLEDCKLFADRWGDLRCNQLTTNCVRAVINDHPAWGPGRQAIFITSIKRAFNWAVQDGTLKAHPLPGLSAPRGATRARDRVITPEEHALVLAAMAKPQSRYIRRLVVALENTGARPGELCNATVADWQDDVGAIVYYRDAARRAGEHRHKSAGRGKDRVIYFTGEALADVRAWVRGKPVSALLFPTRLGTRYGKVKLAVHFGQLQKRTGLPHLVPYVYRHTFATNWLKRGESIEILATLMGNTPATIMHHYAHLIRQHAAMRAHLERVRGT